MQITFDPETLDGKPAALIFVLVLANLAKEAKAKGKSLDAARAALDEALTAVWGDVEKKDT